MCRWDEAKDKASDFQAKVIDYIINKGYNPKEMNDVFDDLFNVISNNNNNELLKKELCFDIMSQIVNSLTKYGIYIGQEIKVEEKDVVQQLKHLITNISRLHLNFLRYGTSFEELWENLQAVKEIISRIKVKEDLVVYAMSYITAIESCLPGVTEHHSKMKERYIETMGALINILELLTMLLQFPDNKALEEILLKHLSDENIKKRELKDLIRKLVKEEMNKILENEG